MKKPGRYWMERIIDEAFAVLAVLCVCGAVWYGVRLVMEALG